MEATKPIRVRWDIDYRGSAGRTKRIARRIREASPKVVELRIEGEKGLSQLPAIFTEIHKCNPWVETTVRLFPGSDSVARRGYSMDFIWEIDAREPFEERLPKGAEAVSFTLDEDSVVRLPGVLEEFAESGARVLHLPNVNAVRALAEVGHVPVTRVDQLREAAETVSRLPLSLAGKHLIVHDYFLWKLFRGLFPEAAGRRIAFLGCQAASALAYVDWEGNVYPCDALPIRLGNLQDTAFEKIWNTPSRLQILETIRATPSGCESCSQMKGCLSGCRGLAYSVSGTLDARDPLCAETTAPPVVEGPSGAI